MKLVKLASGNNSDSVFVLANIQPFEDASVIWWFEPNRTEASACLVRMNRDLKFIELDLDISNLTFFEINEATLIRDYKEELEGLYEN